MSNNRLRSQQVGQILEDSLSCLVNPKLPAKPNKLIVALGTNMFSLIVGTLEKIKYGCEKKLAKSKNCPNARRILSNND